MNDLTKDIDELMKVIKRALTVINCSVKYDLRHCGEIIEVTFQDPPFIIKLNGAGSLRKCSREQALSTVVDDFASEQPTIPFRRSHPSEDPNIINEASERSNKKKRALDDSDEEFVDPEPDFGFSASIDEIKRAHAAPDKTLQRPGNKLVPDASLSNDAKSNGIEMIISRLVPIPFSVEPGIPEPSRRKLKFKVINPNPPPAATQLMKGYVPHAIITVEVLCPCQSLISSSNSSAPRNILLGVDAVFEEITKMLWQTPSESINKLDSSHLRLWFPRSLQIEGSLYTRDQNVLIPLPTSDKSRLYPVLCDNSKFTLAFTEHLASFLLENGPLDNLQRKVKSILFCLMTLR